MFSHKDSNGKTEDWVLVIGSLPVNGHQNAWRAVKDLLKRLPVPQGQTFKDQSCPKIQQVHIFQTSQGRYGVCRFSDSLQARNAFSWIGGNTWHGARLGAWLYRVGSEWHSFADLVDCWEYYPCKNTPLETFWGIGNAFLQRTPTTGPVSPTMRAAGPGYSPPTYHAIPSPALAPPKLPPAFCTRSETAWGRAYRPAPNKPRRNVSSWKQAQHKDDEDLALCHTKQTRAQAKIVICNGSDEDVPCNRETLVG